MKKHIVTFIDSGREPKVAPNPKYPDGIHLDMSRVSQKKCTVALPYPAPRVGLFDIECRVCGLVVTVTAAGRVDDPRTVTLACSDWKSGEVR